MSAYFSHMCAKLGWPSDVIALLLLALLAVKSAHGIIVMRETGREEGNSGQREI